MTLSSDITYMDAAHGLTQTNRTTLPVWEIQASVIQLLISPFCGMFESVDYGYYLPAVRSSWKQWIMEPNKENIMETIKKLVMMMMLAISLNLAAADPININSADKQTLMQVKGIGEKRADAIILWREKNGPFKSVDQLTEIDGIGPSLVETNKELLTVGNTTAQ